MLSILYCFLRDKERNITEERIFNFLSTLYEECYCNFDYKEFETDYETFLEILDKRDWKGILNISKVYSPIVLLLAAGTYLETFFVISTVLKDRPQKVSYVVGSNGCQIYGRIGNREVPIVHYSDKEKGRFVYALFVHAVEVPDFLLNFLKDFSKFLL
jgi:hypothetical protein